MIGDRARRRRLDEVWDAAVGGEAFDASPPDKTAAAEVITWFQSLPAPAVPGPARERARRRMREQIGRIERARQQPRIETKGISMNGTGYTAPSLPWGSAGTGARARVKPQLSRALSFVAAVAIAAVLIAVLWQIYSQSNQATPPPGPASPTALPASSSANWPTMLANNQRTGATEDEGPTGEFVPLWTFTAPVMVNNPIVAGDAVLLQSADGTLYCVDRATGQQRWAFVVGSPVDGNVMSYPAVDGDTVYAGGQWGDVFALDLATGAVRWRTHVADDSIEASILVQDGAVYTGTSAGLFVALNALDGSERWRYEDGQDYINTFPALANGVIYVGGPQSVRALDAASGALVWEAPTDGQVRGAAFEGGVVYAPTAPGSVYALSAADGSQLWMQSYPDAAPGLSVAVSGGTVVAGFGTGGMMGFDAETGEVLWQTPDSGGELTASKVSLANGIAYAYFGPRGGILAVDLVTGQEVGFGATEESRMPPAIVDGVLYVGSETGVAYAFASEGNVSAPVSANATPEAVPTPQPTPTPAPAAAGEGPLVRYLDSFGGWDPAAQPITPMISPDGELWVTTSDGAIAIFDLDGNLKEIWGAPGNQPGQFAFADGGYSGGQVLWKPDGGFYVVDLNGIQEFDVNRSFVRFIGPHGDGQTSGVPGLGLDPDGTLWISYYRFRRIDHLAADGITLLGSFNGEGTPGGVLNSPFGPEITADGRLVVGEQDGNRVRIFDKQGNEIVELGANDPTYGGMYRPGTFTLDQSGMIYIANRDIVDVFDPEGRYVASFGGTGTGEGQFRTVNGIAVNGTKTIFVADLGNNRIQKFAITGPWPAPGVSTTDMNEAEPTVTAAA